MSVPATMKAQVFYEKEKMRLEERPVPEIGPEQVLVKVAATGICGSDVAYYYGKSSLGTESGKGPLVLGHELSGTIAKVGAVAAEKGGLRVGDKVVVNPVQSNPDSPWTKRGRSNVDLSTVVGVSVDGGFAEYCASHWFWTVKCPEDMDLKIAASTEPLACGLYAVRNLGIEKGQFVTIFGPGPIGLMMVQMAKLYGAGKVCLVGTRDGRLSVGKDMGADFVVNTRDSSSPYYVGDLASFIRDQNGGELADRSICATSALGAIRQSVDTAGRASTVVLFGLPADKDEHSFPAMECMLKDMTIRYSWLAPDTWPEAVELLHSGKVRVEPVQSYAFELEGLADAIRKVRDREDNAIKPVMLNA
ncbi:MAG TPA: alcohol dehydrogenase catalytic domain-containing protein [Planctomycetota bacterium]|nr:alcohol dehydrogenase catalytic domain-containing protein [Planctomycetota bacterium]